MTVKESRPAQRLGGQQITEGTGSRREPTAYARPTLPPTPPELSPASRRALAEADARDSELACETGMSQPDILEAVRDMSGAERLALLADGFRWRMHVHGSITRRLDIESEHGIRQQLDWREQGTWLMPHHKRYEPPRSYRERVATRGEYQGGPVHWATGEPATAYEREAA